MPNRVPALLLAMTQEGENITWWQSPEWLLFLATVFLVLVTAALVWATKSLVQETQQGTKKLLEQQQRLLGMRLLLQLSQTYETSMRRFRQRTGELYLDHRDQIYNAASRMIHDSPRQVLDFFDSIGFLEEKGLVDDDSIWAEFGPSVLCYFKALKANAIDPYRRAQGGDPTRYDSFENLYHKVLRIQATQRRTTEELAAPDEERLRNFFEREQTLELETLDLKPFLERLVRGVEGIPSALDRARGPQ
jgi:hypothetical protein